VPPAGPQEVESRPGGVGDDEAHPLLADGGLPARAFEARAIDPPKAQGDKEEQVVKITPEERVFLPQRFGIEMFQDAPEGGEHGGEAEEAQDRHEEHGPVDGPGQEAAAQGCGHEAIRRGFSEGGRDRRHDFFRQRGRLFLRHNERRRKGRRGRSCPGDSRARHGGQGARRVGPGALHHVVVEVMQHFLQRKPVPQARRVGQIMQAEFAATHTLPNLRAGEGSQRRLVLQKDDVAERHYFFFFFFASTADRVRRRSALRRMKPVASAWL
jgi:hypothetical protein